MVHRENVDEVSANRVVDAVRKAMETCTAHLAVLHGVGVRVASDPRQACIHGAKEGLAEAVRS
jgi:hypothetical protein